MLDNNTIITGILFIAAVIRGYTGFGFAAIAILVLSTQYPVAHAVPAVLFIDLLIAIPLVFSSFKETDYSRLRPILIATLLGIPIGFLSLNYLSDITLRIMVPAVILFLAILPSIKNNTTDRIVNSPWLCGLISGWTTSAVSAGGTPVVIHLRHSQLAISIQRATLITYFFITTSLSVGLFYFLDPKIYLLDKHHDGIILICLSGVILGKALFKWKNASLIHHFSYYFILILSAWLLLQSGVKAITF